MSSEWTNHREAAARSSLKGKAGGLHSPLVPLLLASGLAASRSVSALAPPREHWLQTTCPSPEAACVILTAAQLGRLTATAVRRPGWSRLRHEGGRHEGGGQGRGRRRGHQSTMEWADVAVVLAQLVLKPRLRDEGELLQIQNGIYYMLRMHRRYQRGRRHLRAKDRRAEVHTGLGCCQWPRYFW
ncbi:uncharacterized protein BDZ99DRAFT_119966 [Mytilinidion resinicola]|uniref:Uncharacterized protein n=1 Tax=Mytilinidion resinicola TaxID=574789 RepID=A0A6A6Z4H6_9PEZI|nr:uncharacterized protein BDZ99DRAFT_119966 [Mytilinidion resinicola]KAF2815639.1 hypothetical protein BDZ99DRAFT_119966 [Mytilinidion resinicola]